MTTTAPAPTPLATPLARAAEPTLPAVLDAYAALYPNQELVVADDHTATAGELAGSARRFAGHLVSIGLGPGDVIGALVPNGWRWLVAALGAAYAGVVFVPLSTFYRESELREAVDRTHISLLFADRQFFGRDYAGLVASAGLLEASATGRFRGTVFWPSGDPSPEGVDLGHATALSAPIARPDDPAFYVFTSGSSAQPKIVVLNHRNLVLNCYEIGRRQHIVVGDRLWMASPLFFGYGCANALIVVLTHGLTFCLQERFHPVESARFMERQCCSVYYGLGPMTRELVAARSHEVFDLSSLRTGTTGFSPEEKRLAVEVLGVNEVCSVYGLTEGNGHSSMTEAGDDLDAVMHTQGTVLPTQGMRVADASTGKVLAWSDGALMGEIQIRGCVTSGYLEDSASNERAFTPDGWFRTGDLGWLDSRGRLHFAGRLKEVVKVNGITVSPAEVEALVMQHEDVDQAWVFGWPLGDSGEERLCCAVVLEGAADRPEDEVQGALRQWMRQRISSYKVPDRFVVVSADDVPTTSTGKVSRRLIGERYLGGVPGVAGVGVGGEA